MLRPDVTGERWREAQTSELNFWAPQIAANECKPWCNFEPYFATHFEEILKRDWSGKTVLEIGVGAAGAMWMMNAERKIGIEPLANDLLKINPNLYEGYEMISHGAESIPEVEDKSVDCVMSFNALDHCRSIPEVLGEVARVLKVGGTFMFGCDLKSEEIHLDPGHPIAVSYVWFIGELYDLGFTPRLCKDIESRNGDLDGCIFYVGEKCRS